MALEQECQKEYFCKLCDYLQKEYENKTVFPKREEVFNALSLTALSDVRVVIIGQDPYHQQGQAHGLAFSSLSKSLPRSLRNIYKELSNDVGFVPPSHGNLSEWCSRGVLLLNTVLTVREGEPNSHKLQGWEKFTDKIIELLNEKDSTVIFLLWGKNAAEKKSLITSSKHTVLYAPHPSPLSASKGFFGCRHFSQVVRLLGGDFSWQIK